MATKLRLFALREPNSADPIPNLYFSSQPDAKRERDHRRTQGQETLLTWGPDHKKAKTPIRHGAKS